MIIEIIKALCVGIMCVVCYEIGYNHGIDRAKQIIDEVYKIMKEEK